MILPVEWKTELQLLPDEGLVNIHEASLHILEYTGMFMPLAENRLNDLSDLGLKVDYQTNIVRFPADIVKNAVQQAPSSYTLHARYPENDLALDGQHGYLCLDGNGLKVKDLDSGHIRNSTYKDLADAARIADFLPQISFLWPCVSAQDRPSATQPLYELQALMNNSGKHIQAMTAVTPLTAKGTVEMAAAVAGGKAALKQKPITIGTFGTGAESDGWRSGVENAISGAVSLFARGDMICGAGLLDGATIFSFEQLIKDCEIYDILRIVSQGMTISPETLALDDIHQTGPQNHYMLSDHTLKHMHDIWQPTVKGRNAPDTPRTQGISPSDATAAEKAREILDSHFPDPPDNTQVLQEIIDAYDRLATET